VYIKFNSVDILQKHKEAKSIQIQLSFEEILYDFCVPYSILKILKKKAVMKDVGGV